MVPEPRGEHNQEEKAMTTEKDPYLDKPECWLQLDIDDSVRRALIRHFLAFMGAGEGDFFEGKESIERQAWLLADAVIDNVKDEFAEQQYWVGNLGRGTDGMAGRAPQGGDRGGREATRQGGRVRPAGRRGRKQ
jgi:hypothetical protein